MKRVGAVITAAGIGSRKRKKESLYPIDGLSVIGRVIMNIQRAGVKDIVVVSGHGQQTDELKKELRGKGVAFLENEDPKAEMFDSVKLGMKHLYERCDCILITPYDIPFFDEKTVEKLAESGAGIAIPSYNGRAGHPVLIRSALVPDLLTYESDCGLRGWIQSKKEEVDYVRVADEGIAVDTSDQKKVEEMVRKTTDSMLHVKVKVQLENRKSFFGPGMVTLMKQIDIVGSVREACEKMGISYSKAWGMLKTAEQEYGKQLVVREQGGKFGGTAVLSAEGRNLIRRYERLEREIEQFAKDKYAELFED